MVVDVVGRRVRRRDCWICDGGMVWIDREDVAIDLDGVLIELLRARRS